MNTFQLYCFLAVAEYLSFAKAANQLHVTHPAVSQQIQSLEKELNVKLFKRTTRTVKLTEEGKAFLNDAKQITSISERAKKRFENTAPTEIKTISLGCYNFPCLFLLKDTFEKLHTIYPKLHPMLHVIPFQHIYRMLEEGDLDAVIGFKESANLKLSALYKEISKVQMVCICSNKNPISKFTEISIEELKNEPLVLFAPPKVSHPIIRLQGELVGERTPSELYFCESAEAITVLVMANYGISILPSFLIPDTPMISKIPLTNIEPMSFGIYYKSIQGNLYLKTFIEKAKESFSTLNKI